jgi:hypothetical protein
MSAIIDLADAITAVLNAETLSQPFTAARLYVPVIGLEDLAALKVWVVPRDLSMVVLSRRDDDFTYLIDVAVQKSIGVGLTTDAEVVAACDPLMAFTEEIVDLLRSDAVKDSLPGRFMGLANAPIFDPAYMDEKRVFMSLITLNFKLVRAK